MPYFCFLSLDSIFHSSVFYFHRPGIERHENENHTWGATGPPKREEVPQTTFTQKECVGRFSTTFMAFIPCSVVHVFRVYTYAMYI